MIHIGSKGNFVSLILLTNSDDECSLFLYWKRLAIVFRVFLTLVHPNGEHCNLWVEMAIWPKCSIRCGDFDGVIGREFVCSGFGSIRSWPNMVRIWYGHLWPYQVHKIEFDAANSIVLFSPAFTDLYQFSKVIFLIQFTNNLDMDLFAYFYIRLWSWILFMRFRVDWNPHIRW